MRKDIITYICDGASSNIRFLKNVRQEGILCIAHALHIAVTRVVKKCIINLSEETQL
jgi:hypothetical protein